MERENFRILSTVCLCYIMTKLFLPSLIIKKHIFIFNSLPGKLRYISLGSELEEDFLSFKTELCELLLVVIIIIIIMYFL